MWPACSIPILIKPLDLDQHLQTTCNCGPCFHSIPARSGRPEYDHDSIAEKFINMAAVLFNDIVHPAEIEIEPFDNLIGGGSFGEGSETAYVCKDDGNSMALAAEDLLSAMPQL